MLLLLLVSLALRIAFAVPGLNQKRFWDERYSVENVVAVRSSTVLRPRNAYYLGLNHLPQAAVLRLIEGLQDATGREWLPIYRPGGIRLSSKALLVCRIVESIYGTLSLWLVFLVGRRLFSPEVGLLAGLVLSVVPIHIRMSAYFKPDILVLMLSLLAIYWTVSALQRPSLTRYLLVGVGVGLATAAKYTGIPAIIPLVCATLVAGRDLGRRMLWLLGSGVASIAVFVLLNPHLDLVLKYVPAIANRNLIRAAASGTTRADVPFYVIRLVLDSYTHGRLIGAAAVLGLGSMVAALMMKRGDRAARLGFGLVVAFVVGFIGFYCLGSPDLKANLLLSLFPFTSLAAAWFLMVVWREARRHIAILGGSIVAVLVWGSVAGVLLFGALKYTTRELVPTTRTVALQAIDKRLEATRPVAVLRSEGLGMRGKRLLAPSRRVIALSTVELSGIDPSELDLADAEAFPEARLDRDVGSFYRSRWEQTAADGRLTVESRWPRREDASIVVLFHPWTRIRRHSTVGELTREPDGGAISFASPGPLGNGSTSVSLMVWLSETLGGAELTLEGEPIRLVKTRIRRGGSQRWASVRFLAPEEPVTMRLVPRKPDPQGEVEVMVRYWRRGPATGRARVRPKR